MRKIAVLSPAPSSPVDLGNRKRIHRMTHDLKARGFAIHYIFYALEEPWRKSLPQSAYAQMRADWDDFHIVIPTVPYHARPEGDDHELDEWWDPALEKFLWWYLRAHQFDAILVNYIYLSRALTLAPPGTLRILDTHDRFGGRRQMLAQLGVAPEFFYLDTAAEARGLARADLVLAIKDEERSYFSDLAGVDCLSLPYAEAPRPEQGRPAPDPDGYLRIGLLGGRNSVNRRSVETFLAEALPTFFRLAAPVRVVLGGTMCRDLEKYATNAMVEMLGPVDDVAEFYNAVDVVAVPIEHSTGQKIKVAEAMAYGCPVVSLAHAFEGFTPTSPMHRCRTVADLVECCIELSFSPVEIAKLALRTEESAALQEATFSESMDKLAAAITTAPKSAVVLERTLVTRSYLTLPILADILEFLNACSSVELLVIGDETETIADSVAAAAPVVDPADFLDRYSKFNPRFLTDRTALTEACSSAHVIWSLGQAVTRADLPGDWSGTLLQAPIGTAAVDKAQPGITLGTSATLSIAQIGEGRQTLWQGALPCAAPNLSGSAICGRDWKALGRTAVALLPRATDKATAAAVVDALLRIDWLKTVLVMSERADILQEAQRRHPRAGERLQGFAMDRAAREWPEMLSLGVDLSFHDPAFGFAASVLERNAELFFRPRRSMIREGRLLLQGTSLLETLTWIDAAGRHETMPARPPVSQTDGYARLYDMLRELIDNRRLTSPPPR